MGLSMGRAFIITAREMFGVSTASEYRAWVQARPQAPEGVGAKVDPIAPPVVAYINEGRWVADCPDCNAGMMLLPGAPFLCGLCFNVRIGSYSRLVVWPANPAEIEAVLLLRPMAINRNWRPGETVWTLLAENVEHGVGSA